MQVVDHQKEDLKLRIKLRRAKDKECKQLWLKHSDRAAHVGRPARDTECKQLCQYRAVACDVTSAAFNQNVWQNVWRLYRER